MRISVFHEKKIEKMKYYGVYQGFAIKIINLDICYIPLVICALQDAYKE